MSTHTSARNIPQDAGLRSSAVVVVPAVIVAAICAALALTGSGISGGQGGALLVGITLLLSALTAAVRARDAHAAGGLEQAAAGGLFLEQESPADVLDSLRVSVLVPAMNEGRNLPIVLERLPEGLHEVILVDGHSADDTIAAARKARPDIRVLAQDGRGKGDALQLGFEAVTGDVIVMLDADGSADPAEIPRFVATLLHGADFAKGTRFLPGGGSADITPIRRFGNWLLTGLVNRLFGTGYTDLCYGYNAFWAHCLPEIALDVNGFEVETAINLRIAKAGLDVVEVPSFEEERIFGQSNLSTIRDGFRVLATIVKERRETVRNDRRPAPFLQDGTGRVDSLTAGRLLATGASVSIGRDGAISPERPPAHA